LNFEIFENPSNYQFVLNLTNIIAIAKVVVIVIAVIAVANMHATSPNTFLFFYVTKFYVIY